MKTMLSVIAILLIVVPIFGQPQEPQMDSATAAKVGLGALVELAKVSPESVGLTAAEAQKATLGSPIGEFFVPLDRLRAYKRGMAPEALLLDVHTDIYPVLLDGKPRSTITVAQNAKTKKWELVSVGEPAMAQRITQMRAATHQRLIRVPALNVFLLESSSKSGMTLTPLSDVGGTELRAGKAVEAGAAFVALAARAQRVDPRLPT